MGNSLMFLIIFIIELLMFAAISVFGFLALSDSKYDFFVKYRKKFGYAVFGCEIIFVLLSALKASRIIYTGLYGYSGLSLCCAVFGAILLAVLHIKEKIPQRFQRIVRFSLKSMIICAAAELFVFNFNSAHLLGKNYQYMFLSPEEAVSENFDAASGSNISEGTATLEFKNVNIPVGTVYIEAQSGSKSFVDVSIDMSDDTNSEYRIGIASMEIIDGNSRSRTIPVNFSGNVHDLRFSFSAEAGEYVTVKNIILNIPVLFKFSFLRFFIIFLVSIAGYMLLASPLFKRPFGENKTAARIVAYTMTGLLIIASLFLTNLFRYSDSEHSLKKDFTMENGNQMTQELVDAFEAGQVSLLREAEPELLELENPYDWSERAAKNINCAWDHLLFDGKYYSYYGIAPVVAVFLPYHLITDYYFPSVWAVFIFGALGIFFLTKLYMAFMFKFFPETPTAVVLPGLLIMQLITGIWFCFSNPNFYEIAQTSGFACVTAGAFMLITSNVIGNGRIKNWRLALSSVFLSLGVLCRPTLAIYCVAALMFIYAGFRKKNSLYENKTSKLKYYLPYFTCALLPFMVIGGAQMIYNYMRFGSVFDFGIQYSLTINDFTKAEYHTHFVLIGFFNYLFALPSFKPNFPFFDFSSVHTFNPNGYYFVATYSAAGILWKALPVMSYGYCINAYRRNNNKNKILYTILLLAVCVAAPFIIIFSIWESGYGTRYCVDFAWQMLLGALVIAFIIYNSCGTNIRKHLERMLAASALISLVLTVAQVYAWVINISLSYESRAALLSFGRMAEFWR
ncbi:MAG: hypothetical protein NC320_13255 [Clostridium sp.]|nr:hypothetical protein [Clostridium sp.]MCM1548300.1 hypothetical protein [Ruminococcus sp.]